MANHITDRKPVAINKREAPHSALCQFDCRVCTAGTKPNAEYGFVTKDGGFEKTRATGGKLRLHIREDGGNRIVRDVECPLCQCTVGRSVRGNENSWIGIRSHDWLEQNTQISSVRPRGLIP